MMNAENKPPLGEAKPRAVEEIRLQHIRPEELKMYKDCLGSLYYRAGLPFATFCHLLCSWIKPEALPKTFFKKGALFLANVFAGTLLFSPTCYFKLRAMHEAANKRERERGFEQPPPLLTEDAHPGSQIAEDFTYPADLMTNLNEPEGNFSSDFNSSSVLLLDDIKDDKNFKVPSTTYDELRAKHRSQYSHTTPPPSSVNVSQPILSKHTSPKPLEEPSGASHPRKVVKNKYGDEIE